MPGSGHSFSAKNADQLLTGHVDRDAFLGMTKVLAETIQDKRQAHTKKQSRGRGDDRSRGGRSR